jgi:hypothetical protein
VVDRFPGYDVLAKRNSLSWNEPTRRAIDRRLAARREPHFFTEQEFATVSALADRITPQPRDRPPIPVASLIDERLHLDKQDGFRTLNMPPHREAWRRGLRALDAEARQAFGGTFRELSAEHQNEMLRRLQAGDACSPAWEEMPPAVFFRQRMVHDIVFAYWSHPTSWNEIGWGGPASPRGYVRMGYDERDPWEAAEIKDGDVTAALRKNHRVG